MPCKRLWALPSLALPLLLACAPDTPLDDAGPGAGDAGPSNCESGHRASLSVGEAGGTLEHCGAGLDVAPGTFADDVTLSLVVTDLPAAPPFGLEAAGVPFLLEASAALPTDFPSGVTLRVPQQREGRYVHLFHHGADGWNGVEACEVDDDSIGQDVSATGLWVALRDEEVFPESTTGLGEGGVTATFGETTTTFDLSNGYAIYDESEDGTRSISINDMIFEPDDHVLLFRVAFTRTPEGVVEPLEITYGSTWSLDGFWSWVLPVHGTGASVTLNEASDADTLVGTLNATLHLGEQSRPFSATFEVDVEKFRYGPEGLCSFPEG